MKLIGLAEVDRLQISCRVFYPCCKLDLFYGIGSNAAFRRFKRVSLTTLNSLHCLTIPRSPSWQIIYMITEFKVSLTIYVVGNIFRRTSINPLNFPDNHYVVNLTTLLKYISPVEGYINSYINIIWIRTSLFSVRRLNWRPFQMLFFILGMRKPNLFLSWKPLLQLCLADMSTPWLPLFRTDCFSQYLCNGYCFSYSMINIFRSAFDDMYACYKWLIISTIDT